MFGFLKSWTTDHARTRYCVCECTSGYQLASVTTHYWSPTEYKFSAQHWQDLTEALFAQRCLASHETSPSAYHWRRSH